MPVIKWTSVTYCIIIKYSEIAQPPHNWFKSASHINDFIQSMVLELRF